MPCVCRVHPWHVTPLVGRNRGNDSEARVDSWIASCLRFEATKMSNFMWEHVKLVGLYIFIYSIYIYTQSISYFLVWIIFIYVYIYIEYTLLYSHIGGWSSMMFGGSHLEVGDNALAGWPARQRCERGHGIMVMAVNGFNGI